MPLYGRTEQPLVIAPRAGYNKPDPYLQAITLVGSLPPYVKTISDREFAVVAKQNAIAVVGPLVCAVSNFSQEIVEN